jgi:hypothetical protein
MDLERALITAASNKFFPSLINLLGSIKTNYPDHPKMYVYDLGLFWTFKKELNNIPGVEVIKMPKFVSFWRSCYTWKTYIFAHPLARLNFYLDAGCQVLRPLDEIFNILDKEGFFLIEQGVKFKDIVPQEYKELFDLSEEFDKEEALHAGEFGFKNNLLQNATLQKVYSWALAGLALGFSPVDAWRNKGKNKSVFIRNCRIFRHDMTLLNIMLRKNFGRNLEVHSGAQFAGGLNNHQNQYIWNLRLNYSTLDYIQARFLHKKIDLLVLFNRTVLRIMIFAKSFKSKSFKSMIK